LLILSPILLIIGIISLLLGIMSHLLAIIEVLAVRLDQFVGFAGCETRHDVFGDSVVLCDACWLRRIALALWLSLVG